MAEPRPKSKRQLAKEKGERLLARFKAAFAAFKDAATRAANDEFPMATNLLSPSDHLSQALSKMLREHVESQGADYSRRQVTPAPNARYRISCRFIVRPKCARREGRSPSPSHASKRRKSGEIERATAQLDQVCGSDAPITPEQIAELQHADFKRRLVEAKNALPQIALVSWDSLVRKWNGRHGDVLEERKELMMRIVIQELKKYEIKFDLKHPEVTAMREKARICIPYSDPLVLRSVRSHFMETVAARCRTAAFILLFSRAYSFE